MKWRKDIQALRALAVLGVVLFHAGVPLIDGGFTGVDVFFVVSGFLITGMLFPGKDGINRTIPAFLASRVRRLLPPSLATLVVVTLITWLTIDPVLRKQILVYIRDAALQISNITMAIASNEYLAGDVEDNPVMHFWTLGLEWQYYIFWAIIAGVSTVALRKHPRALRTTLTMLLVVLFAGTLTASIILTPQDPGPSYFLLTTRAWEFALGGLAFIAGPMIAKGLNSATRSLLVVAGMVGIVMSFFVIDSDTTFPGFAALLPTLSTAIVIVAGTEPLSQRLNKPIENPVVQRLGATSYSWYLWHWPFLVFPVLWWDQQPLWINMGLLGLSYLAAEASYTFIEQPSRYKIPSLKKPLFALPVAAICIVGAAGFATAIGKAPSPANGNADAVAYAKKVEKDLGPLYADKCQRKGSVTDPSPCYYGDTESDKSIVLWGDSHAGAWFNAVNAAAKANHFKLVYFGKEGCSPIDESVTKFESYKMHHTCERWLDETETRILKMKPELVLVGGRWNRPEWLVPASGNPAARVPGLRDGDTEGAVGLRKRMIVLNDAKQETVILVDNPTAPMEIPRCIARHGLSTTACDFDLPPDNGRTEEASARGLKYIHVVDLIDNLCPNGRCKAMIDGTMTMWDEDHLSISFSSDLAEEMSEALQPYLK